MTYTIGIDQGYTKTRLVILDEGDNLIGELFNSNVFQDKDILTDRQYKNRYIGNIITLIKQLSFSNKINLVFSSNGKLPDEEVISVFEQSNIKIKKYISFNDTFAHYGLSNMNGNSVVLCLGSFYNAAYFDTYNHATLLPNEYWTNIKFRSGLCAYYIGERILNEVKQDVLLKKSSDIIERIKGIINYKRNLPISDYINNILYRKDRGMVMELSTHINSFLDRESIQDYISNEINYTTNLILSLNNDLNNNQKLNEVILSGGVIDNCSYIGNALAQNICSKNIGKVIFVNGNTALGAIMYARKTNLLI